MSEEQIKEISEQLGAISQWQTDHEIADERRHNSFPNMVKEAVEIQINGNLRDIKKHLTEQDTKLNVLDTKIDELKPLSEFQKWLLLSRRFILWIAAPVAIIWTVISYFANKMQ